MMLLKTCDFHLLSSYEPKDLLHSSHLDMKQQVNSDFIKTQPEQKMEKVNSKEYKTVSTPFLTATMLARNSSTSVPRDSD